MAFPPLVEPAAELTPDELRRFSRHVIIPEIGTVGQRRLKNARVACIGAGGLGSPILLYLAAAGVGTIGIVEFDTVDETNLQRQVIHSTADVGRHKADSAAESVRAINPDITVEIHDVALDSDNALEILSQYDVICDGTDNFATRYLVNDACVILGKPYVWGSIFRFEGQASVFWAEHGPHYRDLYPSPPPPGMVPSCAEGGVFGIICAAIGSIMAAETLKLICGIGEPLVGRLIAYDALAMTYRTLTLRRDPATPEITELIDYPAFCGAVSDEAADAAHGRTITAVELRDRLAARDRGEDDFLLVDVREPAEREINQIPGAINVPKNEFMWGDAAERLPRDRPVILHCKSGGRSAECLAVLVGAGFRDVAHVGGGVQSWISAVNPDLPTY